LQTAIKKFDAGEIGYAALREMQDACSIETVQRMEQAVRGVEGSVVCDGEQHAPCERKDPVAFLVPKAV